MKPRIFISAVTSELGTTRQLVANVLSRLGYDPVWQDIFGLEPGDLRQMLRDKIDDCDGLIHLVGRAYGAEPPEPDPGFGRVSYTQFELKYAQQIAKKTWIVFAEDGCSRSKPLEQFDLPHDPAHPDPAGYQAERRALQEAWRERLKNDAHLFHAAGSDAELELKVERLRDEFAELRRHFRSWQQRVLLSTAAIIVLVGVVLAGQWLLKQDTTDIKRVTQQTKQAIEEVGQKTTAQLERVEQAVQQLANPALLAERIRKEIHATAEGKIKALPNEKGRGRLISEIEKERDLALGRVDDLIKLIQDGLKAGASPVFQRAAEILQNEGTDEALAYLKAAVLPRWKRPAYMPTKPRLCKLALRKRKSNATDPCNRWFSKPNCWKRNSNGNARSNCASKSRNSPPTGLTHGIASASCISLWRIFKRQNCNTFLRRRGGRLRADEKETPDRDRKEKRRRP